MLLLGREQERLREEAELARRQLAQVSHALLIVFKAWAP